MGAHFFIFCCLLILLFVLTRYITQQLYTTLVILIRNKKTAIYILTAIYFPGTVVHELAHLCMAFLLHVRAGHLTVIPKIEEGGEVRAGSVSVVKTDPFRLTIIGLAPIPIGILMLYSLTTFFFPRDIMGLQRMTTPEWGLLLGGIYLIFALSCSMFSSKQDLKVLLLSGPILVVMAISMYYLGIRISLEGNTADVLIRTVVQINHVLIITLGIDGVIFGILFLCSQMANRIRHSTTHHHH